MSDLTVLVDMDSILVNLDEKWYANYNERYDDALTHERVVSWDTHLYVKEACGKKIYDILKEPGFYLDLRPLPGAIAGIEALRDNGCNIVVATSAMNNFGIMRDKISWLEKHLPWLNASNIFLGSDKRLLYANVMIDDGPHNIKDFLVTNPLGQGCTIGYPYNRELIGVRRVYRTWEPKNDHEFEMAWGAIVTRTLLCGGR